MQILFNRPDRKYIFPTTKIWSCDVKNTKKNVTLHHTDEKNNRNWYNNGITHFHWNHFSLFQWCVISILSKSKYLPTKIEKMQRIERATVDNENMFCVFYQCVWMCIYGLLFVVFSSLLFSFKILNCCLFALYWLEHFGNKTNDFSFEEKMMSKGQ